jgi:hypothetical protein
LLLFDLFLGSLCGSDDFGELGSDRLVIVLYVLLHLKSESLDGSFKFLLLLLFVAFLPGVDKLEETVSTGDLGLVVMNELPNLSL